MSERLEYIKDKNKVDELTNNYRNVIKELNAISKSLETQPKP